MHFDEYLDEARQTAIYPREDAYAYLALGLNGEAGEVAEKIKRLYRDVHKKDFEGVDVAPELGDVLWYLALLADEFGYSLEEIAEMNLAKLRDRRERGVIEGSGDHR